MGLIDTLTRWINGGTTATRSGYDPFAWATIVSGQGFPLMDLAQTLPGGREEEIESSFASYVGRAYKSNPVVFACMLSRLMVFSEGRFQFRQLRNGRPGSLFGTPELAILEHPFGPTSATGDLLARAITDVDAAGNFFATRRGDRIVRMRPDWVHMIYGTNDPDTSSDDLDAEFLGIAYWPGGEYSGARPVVLQRGDIVHWAPIPDPLSHVRGMSWLTPIVREVMGDSAATSHKLAFFEKGATPNMVVKRQDAPAQQAFQEWVAMMEAGHAGAANAYKTLYLTAGADATVVGRDLQQLDFKNTQGAGETRIAAAAGIHPVVVGLSEGMQGSSLNAGNFGSARRLTADKTFRPLWRNFAGSLETLVRPPAGSQLWVDTRDIAFLREDSKDAADIQQIKAQTIRTLTDGGYKPDSVIAAVEAEDMSLLVWTGLVSVQLQPPGSQPPTPPASGGTA